MPVHWVELIDQKDSRLRNITDYTVISEVTVRTTVYSLPNNKSWKFIVHCHSSSFQPLRRITIYTSQPYKECNKWCRFMAIKVSPSIPQSQWCRLVSSFPQSVEIQPPRIVASVLVLLKCMIYKKLIITVGYDFSANEHTWHWFYFAWHQSHMQQPWLSSLKHRLHPNNLDPPRNTTRWWNLAKRASIIYKSPISPMCKSDASNEVVHDTERYLWRLAQCSQKRQTHDTFSNTPTNMSKYNRLFVQRIAI